MDTAKRTVIFDFDGTLADTFVSSIRIFEKLMHRNKPYSPAEIQRLRGLTALHIVRELRIRPWKLPWLMLRGRALMRKEVETIVIFEGLEAVLQQLEAAGIDMYIISSNSPGTIRKVMEAKGLSKYFKRIYGNVGIFGKAKMLRKVMDRNQLEATSIYYVGDEGRDVEAAKRVHVHSVAVGWGFNTPDLLAKHHPSALVTTPQELADALLA